MAVSRYRRLQPQYADTREIAEITNQVLNGKTNNTGEVTLPHGSGGGSATYTVYDERAGFNSVILFMPLSNTSAGKLTSIYVSQRNKGNFIITYNDSGSVNIELAYAIIG